MNTENLTLVGDKDYPRMVNLEEALGAFFELDDLEFRVGSTSKKGSGMVLTYVTNRAIQKRLDEVVGAANWRNEFHAAPNDPKSASVMCGISIRINGAWVTKFDVGNNSNTDPVKGGFSDSMKRAAVEWGIGRYLYQLPAVWVDLEQGKFLPRNLDPNRIVPAEFRPKSAKGKTAKVTQSVEQAQAETSTKRKLTKADRARIAKAAAGKDAAKAREVYDRFGLTSSTPPDDIDVDEVVAELEQL